MANRKHTRCSQCTSLVNASYLEVQWRKASRGPWHYVAGWLCARCIRATIDFIDLLGADVIAWDG
jgi:hypothetical protein